MAFLQALNGLNAGQLFPLQGKRSVLGRHPDCDIVLDVGAVSRQHAQILELDHQFYVEDLESRNGTFVNNELVKGRHRLQENDQVKVCDLLFSFHLAPPKPLTAEGDTDDSEAALGQTGGLALLVEDSNLSSSTIMSTVKASRAGLRASPVNAEMKLKALLEITHALGAALSLDDVLPKLLDSLFKIFLQADRGFVVLQVGDNGPLIPKAVKQRRGNGQETIRISRTIVRQAMEAKEAILSADAATDSRFDSSQSIADFRIRSMMCAPLVDSDGHALGVIQIDTLDQRTPFLQDDLDVLASVAGQAAFAVENAQLHEAALRRQVLERDLQLARSVQQGFLPQKAPEVEGYEFFDFYEPANQVGGDYFDYVPLPGGRLAVIVADVSGKGIAAALLMAKLSSEARYVLASSAGPAEALMRLNAGFTSSWEDRFVTCALAIIDCQTHEVQLANAGHMAPFLRHPDQRVESIGEEQTGVPLGVAADFPYEQLSIALEAGAGLALFTDGFSEAMNRDNELYGLKRLEQQLHHKASGVKQLGQLILSDVKQFVGNRSQSDDMCLLCFGRNPGVRDRSAGPGSRDIGFQDRQG
ncbi:MAG TPA: SpoIIE family protein phosphatase [Pirellulales bacterium]|nr:SpoIIE family protein phosphatase [Pirellulales bacterium]